jgi:hypothetical protein
MQIQITELEICKFINTAQDDKENVAPTYYSLPFGGPSTCKECKQEQRSIKFAFDRQIRRNALKTRVLNGQEPSGLLDTGATSAFIAPNDMKYLQPMGIPSNKSVRMPNGIIEKAGEKMIMNNGLRTPANSADAIPSLKTTLVSNSKLADAQYITVYDDEEVNVCNGNTTTILPTRAAVLTADRLEGQTHRVMEGTVASTS